jgi:hypothetical protein
LLLDPSQAFIPDASLLMEYCSPSNQIVVKYDEPKLVALGYSCHDGDNIIIRDYLGSSNVGLDTLKSFNVEHDVLGLKDIVSSFEKREGLVVWTPNIGGGYHLSKFKSLWYLRLHALRTQATPRYIKEFCFLNGIDNLEQFKEIFFSEGFDWEIVQYTEPLFNDYISTVKNIDALVSKVDASMEASGIKSFQQRKDIAILAKKISAELGNEWFGYIMAKATGDSLKANDIISALKLDMSLTQFLQLKKAGIKKLGIGDQIDDG